MTLAVNKTQDQTMFPTTVGGRTMGLFKQRYAETITYLIDYSQWLEDGDTISDSNFTISPQTSPAVSVIGKTIQDGNKVLFQIENGAENTRYVLTVEITTSTGQVKDDYFQLNIGTPPGDAQQSGVATALSAAQTAQVGAETAQTGAQAAQTGAQTARTGAEIARTGAETAQAAAVTAKTGAETAAAFAQTKAGEAQLAESNALLYKNIAVDKAGETLINATAANQSATTANTKASEAAASATSAATSAATATTKAADASTYSSSAATSAATATTKANQASASETNAAASAATATTKAGEASASATAAAASASTATTKASEASTSANNASTSATSANTANTAAQSAKTAAQSAQTAAQAAQTAAQNAQVAAESARDATLSAYDSFDDRYLGAKASDPTLDNDGNALVAGTLYFNTTINQMKIYLGASWTAAYVAGEGVLMKANNLSDITSASSARANLGLGGAAVLNVGTVASTVAAGDDSRITGAAQKSANLSDLTNAATARTNLGLGTAATQDSTAFAAASHTHAISDVTNLQTTLDAKQPLDADLTAIAGLAGTSGILKKTAADTWTLDTTSYLASSTIGASVQAWDADLDAIAALAGTSGLLKKTAANTWSLDTNTYLTSINNNSWSGTQLSVGNGGTGATSLTGILKGNGTNAFTAATAGTDYVAPGGALGTPASGNLANCTFPTLNQNTTGTAAGLSATLVASSGGTGNSSYTIGDILYASGTTALSKLAGVATGNALISGGVGTAPSWGKVGLTTHVSGTLPVANGGTGATSLTGILKGNGTNAFTAATAGTDYVAPGGALGTPASGNLANCTFPTLNQNTTGTAAGLSATLVASSGGTGNSSYTIGDILYASGTTALSKLADVATGNALISGGVGTAPSWGKVGLTTHVSGTLPVANGGTGITSFGTGVATALGNNTNAASGLAVLNASGYLNVAQGGTGLGSLAAGYIPYGNGTGALSSTSNLSYSGVQLSLGGTDTTLALTTYGKVQLVGGNSTGYIYGSFSGAGDGLHLGYNFYYNAAGTGIITNTGGGTTRLSITYSDFIFMTGATNTAPTEKMRLSADGNLLVGTTTTSYNSRLVVKSSSAISSSNVVFLTKDLNNSDLFFVRTDGAVALGDAVYNNTTSSAANAVVGAGGYVYRSTSSIRYKNSIQSATHGLDAVLSLRPVTFRGNNDGDKVFGGLIAEEVDEVGLSEFVAYDKDGRPDAIHYGNMVSLAFKAIQELAAKVSALEAKQ